MYEFVASTVRDNVGEEGMKFFPLVFSLFIFVLICNLLGMMPGGLHRHEPDRRDGSAGAAS